jgi:hypothetical protein
MDNKLAYFLLKQNPQFYTRFPIQRGHFPNVLPYIPALYAWNPVESYTGGTLHLIVDRDRSGREVELEDLTRLPLPGIYGNGWFLENDREIIAVRDERM